MGEKKQAAAKLGVVLDKRENRGAVGGEIWNHVGFLDDDLPIQDVIVGVVATVDDPSAVYHQSRGVTLAVGAGVRLVGRHAVVGEKLIVAVAEDDEASAGTFNICCDVNPIERVAQRMINFGRWVEIMCRVWV